MNIKKNKMILTVLSFCIIITTSPLFAAKGFIKTTVEAIVVTTPVTFGGCMIKMGVKANSTGLNCTNNNYISLSCTGDFNSKDLSYKMLDTAQMALALGNEVNLQIYDTKKHNGYCVASRIDILSTP